MQSHRHTKPPFLEFFLIELATFICQMFIFFMVAVVISVFLSDKDRLVAYASSRLGDIAIQELVTVIFVSFAIVGVLYPLSNRHLSRWAERLIERVLQDIPRTIYLFGSSVAGVLLAICIFSLRSGDPSIVATSSAFLSIVSAIAFFAWGCLISFYLK